MIDFLPDADQQALVASVTDFLANEMPIERLRPRAGSAQVPAQTDHWREFADMGWFGIGVAEARGGIGLTVAEQVLVFRELGRYLVSPNVLGAVLAAHITATCDSVLCGEIIAGRHRVALGHATAGHATAHHLVDAAGADFIVRLDADGLALFAADAFIDRRAVSAFDGALSLERAERVGPAQFISSDRALQRTSRLLTLAMVVGAAEASLKLAVDYAKLREQFGQVIAKFQAIKHLCADLAVRAEAAWSQTVLAALAARGNLPEAEFEAATAEIVTTAAAIHITEQSIQIHGGIGFTAECDAHHFLKRVRLLATLLGGPRQAQVRLLAEPVPQ